MIGRKTNPSRSKLIIREITINILTLICLFCAASTVVLIAFNIIESIAYRTYVMGIFLQIGFMASSILNIILLSFGSDRTPYCSSSSSSSSSSGVVETLHNGDDTIDNKLHVVVK